MFNDRETHYPLCYGGFMGQPGRFGCQMGQDMKCDHWCNCMSKTRENMNIAKDHIGDSEKTKKFAKKIGNLADSLTRLEELLKHK